MTGLEAATLINIGAGVSAGSSILGAIAGARRASFQADVARSNAKLGRGQARAEEDAVRRSRSRRMADLRAALGASGVQASGSPLELLADQAMEAELDAQRVRFSGRAAARQEIATARNFESSIVPTLLGGLADAGSTLLTASSLQRPGGLTA